MLAQKGRVHEGADKCVSHASISHVACKKAPPSRCFVRKPPPFSALSTISRFSSLSACVSPQERKCTRPALDKELVWKRTGRAFADASGYNQKMLRKDVLLLSISALLRGLMMMVDSEGLSEKC
jgi:hypothetical protein